jgi:hypothetical protein
MIRRDNLLLILTICLAAACLSGCSSAPELMSARQAEERGELIEAAFYLDLHLNEHPRDRQAQARRSRIDQKIFQRLISEADAALNSPDKAAVPELTRLLSDLDKRKEKADSREELDSLTVKIQKKIGQLKRINAKAARKMGQALESNNLKKAARLFREIKRRDSGSFFLRDLEPRLVDLYSQHLNLVIQQNNGRNLILEINREEQEIKNLGLDAENQLRLINVFEVKKIQILRREIQKDIAAKRFYYAYLSILKNNKPDLFFSELAEIKDQGSRFYLSQAQKRMARKEVYRAYLEAEKACELNPGLPEMFDVYKQARSRVLDSLAQLPEVSESKTGFAAPQVLMVKKTDQKMRFIEEARQYIARNQIKQAMRPLAQGFLYSLTREKSLQDASFKTLRNLVLEHTEKNFL